MYRYLYELVSSQVNEWCSTGPKSNCLIRHIAGPIMRRRQPKRRSLQNGLSDIPFSNSPPHEHLDTETGVITYCDLRDEWAHGNTIVHLTGDRVMVSFRNISTVGIIDKNSGQWTWKIDYNTLAQQHAPSMLDNGAHRKNHPLPHFRVIEVSTSTSEIVWPCTDTPLYNFFSSCISGAHRPS